MKLFGHQRGDTIVEVLIAVAILAFVVTSASATTTRSSSTVRASQERGEALKLAQSQVEYIIANKGLPVSKGCFDSAGLQKDPDTIDCAFQSGGGSGCDINVSTYCYKVRVNQTPVGTAGANDLSISTSYDVRVDWDSPSGGSDTLNIVYKLLTPNLAYVPPFIGTGSIGSLGGGPKLCDATGTCLTAGKWAYRLTFKFVSTNVPLNEIAFCTWRYSDGSGPDIVSNCQPGDTVTHDFPEVLGYPRGGDCDKGDPVTRKEWQVTMVITKTNGSPVPTTSYTAKVPYCNVP